MTEVALICHFYAISFLHTGIASVGNRGRMLPPKANTHTPISKPKLSFGNSFIYTNLTRISVI